MINEEIYVLTKHGNFNSEYIENIPVYRRRFYLHLLQKEFEELEKIQEQEKSKYNKRLR